MNIAPVELSGMTPDEQELSKGGAASRGWLHGFWDCFSDPATCCFSTSPSLAVHANYLQPTAVLASSMEQSVPHSRASQSRVSRMVPSSASPLSAVLPLPLEH